MTIARAQTVQPRIDPLTEPPDPKESAQAAGLRYVTDAKPGIRRVRCGKGFRYTNPGGATIHDTDTLRRIRSLVIPPAWTGVWICTIPNGHLQATGRDARGRKQSRYHPRWREVRDETKYERMLQFAQTLPAIRERGLRIETTGRSAFDSWRPPECPLCASGIPLEDPSAPVP